MTNVASYTPVRMSTVLYCGSTTHLIADIKMDNILIGVQQTSVLDKLVQDEEDDPSARKVYPDRTIYQTRFGTPFTDPSRHIELSDFDSAVRVTDDQKFHHPIQPLSYRCPEVLIGVPWTYSADIWNIGVLVSTCIRTCL